ncbi:MAG: hypothetical protein AB7D47_13550, partial [Desulfovibrio sp.]
MLGLVSKVITQLKIKQSHIIFLRWSSSLLFFLFSRQDTRTMQPLTGNKGATDLPIPWVLPAGNYIAQGAGSSAMQGKVSFIKRWEDQARCFQAVQDWLHWGSGDGRWGILGLWPCRPSSKPDKAWLPLSVAIVTGANGVGKSQLSMELAHVVARHVELGLRPPEIDGVEPWTKSRCWMKKIAWWFVRNLPCTRRATDDPWDVGRVENNSGDVLTNLESWRPRRPTLLIIDEPSENVIRIVDALAKQRMRYWHPVRLLLIDQSLPTSLNSKNDDYLRCDCATPSAGSFITHAQEELMGWYHRRGGQWGNSPVPFFFKGAFDLGEVRFTSPPVRAIWSKAARVFLPGKKVNNALKGDQDFEVLSKATAGNPLLVVLAVEELMQHNLTLEDLRDIPQADRAQKLIRPRAENLYANFKSILQDTPSEADKILRAIAAASVCGGLWYELEGLVEPALVERLFPDRGVYFDATKMWIPPVRPKAVGAAFVQVFLDKRGGGPQLARMAWEKNMAGCIQALHTPADLPPVLYGEVAAIARERLPPPEWAQVSAAALLFGAGPAAVLHEALQCLSTEDLAHLGAWLSQQLQTPFVHAPEPMAVLIAIGSLMTTLMQAGRARPGEELDQWRDLYREWGEKNLGAIPRHSGSRQQELSASRMELLPIFAQRFVEHSPHDTGGRTERAEEGDRFAAFTAWLLQHIVDKLPIHPLEESFVYALRLEELANSDDSFLKDVGMQRERAEAWCFVCYAAAQLGGAEGLQQSRSYAERVEEVSTSDATFLQDVLMQGERAAAWRSVCYAACKLGGAEGFQQSRSYAERVEEVSTSDATFLQDVLMQRERAIA